MPIPEFDPDALALGETLGEIFWLYQTFVADVALPGKKAITAEDILKKVEPFFRHESQAKDFSEGFLAQYEIITALNE